MRRFPSRLNERNTLQLPELPDPSTSLGSTIAKLAEKEKAKRQNNVGGGVKETPLSMRIIRFGVYMWAIRLGCLGLGMLFGTAPGMLFSFFHMQDQKRYLLPEWQWRDVEALGASQLLSSKVPMFVRNVTVAAEETIDFILAHASFTSPLKINMKGDNVFASYAGEMPWAARHNVSPPLDYLLYANPSDYKPFRYSHDKKLLSFDQRKQQQCSTSSASSSSSSSQQQQQYCDRGAHWYLSERISEPLSNPLLKALAPVFPPFIKSQKHQVQVHLLLASEHALCAPHYELEDNFFMQLTGTKTFTISSPNTLAAYRAFPKLHPSHRQAQRDHLSSPEAIHDALEESNRNNSSGYFNWFPFSKKSTPALTENNTSNSNSSNTNSSSPQSVGVWQVTLLPGDLLFLPAFYPHSVAMGANSVSLNARVPSLAVKAYDTLIKEWELPFSLKKDTKGIQLASLGHMLKMASYEIVVGLASTQHHHSSSFARHIELLRETLKLRYEDAARDERFPACALPPQSTSNAMCVQEDIDKAFENHLLKKASHKMESTLSLDVNEPSVRLLLLIDFIDEKLDQVLGEDSSPCNFARFAFTCL